MWGVLLLRAGVRHDVHEAVEWVRAGGAEYLRVCELPRVLHVPHLRHEVLAGLMLLLT